jgi:hypothetical protein
MTTDEVPGEVREAVRAAARMTTGYGGRLEDVYRRGRRRRRRQTGAAFAGVVVVLLGVGLLTVDRDTTPTPQVPLPTSAPVTPSPSATSPSPAPVTTVAQRLFLHMAGGKYSSAKTDRAKLGNGAGIGELTPDGRIVVHKEVGADAWDTAVGLPDGRIVTFGPEDLTGTARTDGPNVSGLAQNLLVISPKGKVQLSRDVHKPGMAGFLTANAETAYLWRKTGLFTHTLKTGAERRVLTTKDLGVAPLSGEAVPADARDDQVVFGRNEDGCFLKLADLRTGTVASLGGEQTRNCGNDVTIRLSPDGTAVAVGIEGTIKIISLPDGRDLKVESLVGGYNRADTISYDFAWQDDRTLRVVRVPYGEGTHDLEPYTITY